MLSITISPKEYNYALMLEKWFLSEDRDLQKLGYMIDYQIPMDIENEELFYLLSSLGWYYDGGDNSEHNSTFIKLKSELNKILDFKVSGKVVVC